MRFLMILPALAMCLCVASCSDDDDNSTPGGGTGIAGKKKLAGIVLSYWGKNLSISYDNQGRISRYEWSDGETGVFSYRGNTITVTETSDGEVSTSVASLNDDGYMTSVSRGAQGTVMFTYDDQGQLSKAYFPDGWEETITWENGNLVKVDAVSSDGDRETWTYEYTDYESWKGVVYWDDLLIDISIPDTPFNLLANAGYLGKMPKNLLAGAWYESGDTNISYSYKFGDDGYVSEISGNKNGYGGSAKLLWQ